MRLAALCTSLTGCFVFVAACGARTSVLPTVIDAPAPPPDAGGGDAGCPGASATPTVLASFTMKVQEAPTLWAFAVTGEGAFVEVADSSNNPLGIFRIPVGGGIPTNVIPGQDGCPSMSPFANESPLVTDGTDLFMVSADFTAGCQGSSPTVTTYDLATGALGAVPAPSGTGGLDVYGLWATEAARGAYYVTGSEFDPSTSVLVHWDGSASTAVATLPEWTYEIEVVGRTVFALGRHAIYQVQLAGGAVSQVVSLEPDAGVAALLGATATALFYSPRGGVIVRRDAVTGESTTVLSLDALSLGPVWVDDRYVYFGGYEDPRGLVTGGLYRVPVGGGAAEAVWTQGSVRAVATAGCEVYWLSDENFQTGAPPELLAMAE